MSRSALVTTRWSKTKPPLSLPATRRSDGSHSRRSGWVNICSSRSSGGTAAGTQSQSASKWQSRVSVSRLAAPPQRGQATSTKSGRSASGLPSPVGCEVARQHHRQVLLRHRHRAALLAVDDRDRRAPVALARDREVVGPVARRLAGALGRGGRRSPRPSSVGAAAASTRSIRAAMPRSASSIGGDAERGGRPEAGVDERRDDDRQLPAAGADDRVAGVDQRHRAGVAGAALPAARAQLAPAARGPPDRRPRRRPRGGAARAERSWPARRACGAG